MNNERAELDKKQFQNRNLWLAGLVLIVLLLVALWMDTNFVGASEVESFAVLVSIPSENGSHPVLKTSTQIPTPTATIQETTVAPTLENVATQSVELPQSGPAATRIAEIKLQLYQNRRSTSDELSESAAAESSQSSGSDTSTEIGIAPQFNPLAPLEVLIQNGGFENGPGGGWEEYSNKGYAIIYPQENVWLTVSPHNGFWLAWLVGAYNEETYLRRQVTVPDEAPYLRYWIYIESSDTICGPDRVRLLINGTQRAAYNLCADTHTGRWMRRVTDLSAYAGQAVSLEFTSETNSTGPSRFYLDDLAFISVEEPPQPVFIPLLSK